MQPQTAGEKTVAIRNVNVVVFFAAGRRNRSRRTVCPNVNVMFGVADNRLFAGRAGGSVNALQLFTGNGKKPERIVVTQILFYGKRKFCDVVNRVNVAGQQTDFIKLLFVKRHVVIAVFHHFN